MWATAGFTIFRLPGVFANSPKTTPTSVGFIALDLIVSERGSRTEEEGLGRLLVNTAVAASGRDNTTALVIEVRGP